MIQLLRIRNFAIIDQCELEFQTGFNVITGETGAGKSIILDAIGLILGNRSNTDVIRTGSDEAIVEAVFDIGSNQNIHQKLVHFGINQDKNESNTSELLVKRVIHRNGKNKIFINGELVTLAQLSELCSTLVELCSQHEHQSLSKPSYHLDLVDKYGGLLEKRAEVSEIYSAIKSLQNELQMLDRKTENGLSEIDFLKFQQQEIAEFSPKENEEEELLADRRKLMNATKLSDSVGEALASLDGSESVDVATLITKAIQKLTKAVDMDSQLQPYIESLEKALVEVKETALSLSSYMQDCESDPARLEQVEDRLNTWSNMKRKYGAGYAEIMTALERIEKEIYNFENKQERIEDLNNQIRKLKADFTEKAKELSKKRKNIAKTLVKTLEAELSELSMTGSKFIADFKEIEMSSDGIDKFELLFSANSGEEAKPMAKIASGGELSRVLLALRRTIADRGGISVYLFDEIDAGIGGQTASVVGRKLKSVSKHNQVICITHLAQVAAFADNHFTVSKSVEKGRTISHIDALTNTQRVDEIARMLGGLKISEKTRAHAKEILKESTI